jgi:hypothetical protein
MHSHEFTLQFYQFIPARLPLVGIFFNDVPVWFTLTYYPGISRESPTHVSRIRGPGISFTEMLSCRE